MKNLSQKELKEKLNKGEILNVEQWVELLKVYPELKSQCECFGRFMSQDWYELLKVSTFFDDVASENQEGVVALIILGRKEISPQISKSLDGFNLLDILATSPEYAQELESQFNVWKDIIDFCPWPPVGLMIAQPQFIKKLEPYGLWEQFTHPYYWYCLLEGLKENYYVEKAKASLNGWVALLIIDPSKHRDEFKKYSSLEERHWGTLLALRDEFKALCIKIKGEEFYNKISKLGIEESIVHQEWNIV